LSASLLRCRNSANRLPIQSSRWLTKFHPARCVQPIDYSSRNAPKSFSVLKSKYQQEQGLFVPPQQSHLSIGDSSPSGLTLKRLLKSIVKINVVTAGEGALAWQRGPPDSSSGSGFIVRSLNDPNELRIITNAHVVANDTMVRVEKYGSSKNYTARVIARSYECDVSVLTIEDEDADQFYKDCLPLEWDTTPILQETVYVVGHPSGGSGVCFTKGVVSRLSMISYSTESDEFTGDSLLGLQVDAAVNPGNSGGPLLSQDYKVKGIVFQKSYWEENQGYCIPAEVALHFLKTDDKPIEEMDEREQNYQKKFRSRTATYKFPMLEFKFQNLDNARLQKYSGLHTYNQTNNTNLTGVLISRIHPSSETAQLLKVGDVVCEIDGFKIDNHGEVQIDFSNQPSLEVRANDQETASGHNFSFLYLLKRKFVGDKYKLKILRDQKIIDIELTAAVQDFLIEPASEDRISSYMIVGGIVFEALTNLHNVSHVKFASLGAVNSSAQHNAHYIFHNWRSYPEEEIVLCSHILPHKTNATYLDNESLIVRQQLIKFNGQVVHNLKHLHTLVKDNKEQLLAFEMASGYVVVLDKDQIEKANKSVLKQNDIRSLYSKDLRQE